MSNINVNNLTPLLGSGSSVSISGSLVVKNDVTIGGHLYIGDQDNDNVKFSAEVSSSVIPNNHNVWDLGSLTKQWSSIYVDSLVTHHITASGNISASGTGVNGTGSFHHVTVNGDITASGTGSFQQGVTANQSSSFTYISMSGALKTAYHVSASKLQLTETAEIYGSASMGYISSSGDLTASGTGSFGGGIDSSTATGSFGQVTAVGDVSSSGTGSFMDVFIDDNLEVQGDTNLHGNISGSGTATASFGHISASGDISTSTAVHSVQYFTDSLIFATGDQALNTVKLGGGASVTQLHGLSIDISGSVSMSGALSMSGANADIITEGAIYALGQISSSGALYGRSIDLTSNGENFFNVTAGGAVSGASTLAGTALTLATNGVNAFTATTAGAISASSTIAGTALTLATAGTTYATIDALGTGSFLGGIDCIGDAKNATGSFGYISCSEDVSSSGTVFGETLIAGTRTTTPIIANGSGDDIVTLGTSGISVLGASEVIGNLSSSAILFGTALTVTTNGVHKASIDASGNIAAEGYVSSSALVSATSVDIRSAGVQFASIGTGGIIQTTTKVIAEQFVSSSAELLGNELGIAHNGINVASISNAGAISASSTIAGTALTLATNGVTKASITADGTGSFGYVSASGDISTSTAVHSVQYYTDSLLALTGRNSLCSILFKLPCSYK
jgi:hypothetical protein